MTVVGATFLSFVIVFILELIFMRKAHETFAEAAVFYKGMGSAFGTATIVGIAGTLFSTALTMVGGIELLATKVASIPNLPIAVVLVLFTVIHAVMFYVTGSGPVCIFTLLPILNTLLTTAGRTDLLIPAMLCISVVAQGIGQACTPISAATPVRQRRHQHRPHHSVQAQRHPLHRRRHCGPDRHHDLRGVIPGFPVSPPVLTVPEQPMLRYRPTESFLFGRTIS